MPVQQAFSAGSTTNASVALTNASGAVQVPGDGENMLIYNARTVPVACDFSLVSLTATAASPLVVPPGSRMIVTIGRAVLLPAVRRGISDWCHIRVGVFHTR